MLQDSCLPTSSFVWEVENKSKRRFIISLTFTFKNGDGSECDKKKKCASQTFTTTVNSLQIKGVALDHEINGNATTYGLGCLEQVSSFSFLKLFITSSSAEPICHVIMSRLTKM